MWYQTIVTRSGHEGLKLHIYLVTSNTRLRLKVSHPDEDRDYKSKRLFKVHYDDLVSDLNS